MIGDSPGNKNYPRAVFILLERSSKQDLTDNGRSGGSYERPDWKRLIRNIEAGLVGNVLVKGMSRAVCIVPQHHERVILRNQPGKAAAPVRSKTIPAGQRPIM